MGTIEKNYPPKLFVTNNMTPHLNQKSNLNTLNKEFDTCLVNPFKTELMFNRSEEELNLEVIFSKKIGKNHEYHEINHTKKSNDLANIFDGSKLLLLEDTGIKV